MSATPSSLRCAALAASLIVAGMAWTPAHAFADDDARRAILELRAQVKQISDQNQAARLQLADQMETMQRELTQIRGELERIRWEQDLNKRASQDQSGGNEPQAGNPQEQAAFNEPMGLFRSGKYKEASSGFTAFLGRYPQSPLAPEARFYQGSSQYASKDFKGSIQSLQGLVQSDPADPRAADALLIVAASQIELNNLAGAKATLQKIVKDYSQTSAAETARNRLKLLR